MSSQDPTRATCSDESPINRKVASQSWKPTTLALAALCGVVLAFYHRLWWPDLALAKRDAVRFFLPLKRYAAERLAAGELPQWFPYEGLGRPFLAIPNTGVFHPFTALYLWLAPPEAYRLTVLLSCLAAALGMFALARALAIPRAGACLSGVAFACSGYVVSLTENIVYLYSICLLPVFLLALEKLQENNPAWMVAPAVVWASVFLHGDVQTGYYYGLIAIVWMWTRCPGSRRRAWLRLAGVGGLAALLAGIQLAPAAGLYLDSERRLPSFSESAFLWSTHPLRLATLVAAPIGDAADHVEIARYFFGGRPPGEPPVGFWAESIYLGMPVVGLAVLGGWVRRDLKGLVLLGGLALVLSLGKYGGLYAVFSHVLPLWSAFRYPERLMGVAVCAISLLAGAGAEFLRKERRAPGPWWLAAGACAALGAGLFTEAAGRWAETSGAPAALARNVAEASGRAFLFSALVSTAVGAIAVGLRRALVPPRVWMAALLAVVTLDLARANQDAYHTAPVDLLTTTPVFVEALRHDAKVSGIGRFRVLSVKGADTRYPTSVQQVLDSAGLSSLALRQSLEVEINAEFGVESIKVYMPGYRAETAAMVALAARKFSSQTYARYNVRYFIGRTANFKGDEFRQAIVAAAPEYDLVLVRNPSPAKPRAYLAARPEATRGPVNLETLIARPDFSNGAVDVVETEEGVLPALSEGGAVTIRRYEPEVVEIHVATPTPAVLILLDAFDPGWRAVLDSRLPVPIMRANGLVRAVVVPAGSHTVTFRYRTPWLTEGMWLSLCGGMLCGTLLVRGVMPGSGRAETA